jgi:uncharacterized protein (DUF2225 family)
MSNNLLSGLGKFGLGNLQEKDIFEKPEEKKVEKAAANLPPAEEELLFDKTYDCPLCHQKFQERTVRAGKARLVGIDTDLRQRHEHIDTGKYDVVSCPICGFTVLGRYFAALSPTAAKLVKENISASFIQRKDMPATYSYDYAFERYQLCLANAIVKRGKDSEKAYICLKTGWILRGMAENLDKETEGYEEKHKEIKNQEKEFLRHAYDGFVSAQSTEGFPMCGMDETTVDYLLATLSITFKEFEAASRMISRILASTTANARIKDKARDLKEVLKKEWKG